jgi:hypothetical protein
MMARPMIELGPDSGATPSKRIAVAVPSVAAVTFAPSNNSPIS